MAALVAPGAETQQRCDGPSFRQGSARIDHSAQVESIPHTARWIWMEDDETIWRECLTGCRKVSSFQ